jgi:hypothetical protein
MASIIGAWRNSGDISYGFFSQNQGCFGLLTAVEGVRVCAFLRFTGKLSPAFKTLTSVKLENDLPFMD